MVKNRESKLTRILQGCTSLGWMEMALRNILTQQSLERLCDWFYDNVEKFRRRDFDSYKGYAKTLETEVKTNAMKQDEADRLYLICLCISASSGLKSFFKTKAAHMRKQVRKKTIPCFDEDELIRACLKELNSKVEEFAETLSLLPEGGLLVYNSVKKK